MMTRPPLSCSWRACDAQPSPSTTSSWCTGLTGTDAGRIQEALHLAQASSERRNYPREARAFAVWWISRGHHSLLAALVTVTSYLAIITHLLLP